MMMTPDWRNTTFRVVFPTMAELDVLQCPFLIDAQSRDSIPMEHTTNADRKSTRLNSSHQIISYAVFFLKKKITRRNSSGENIPYLILGFNIIRLRRPPLSAPCRVFPTDLPPPPPPSARAGGRGSEFDCR